MFGVAQRLFERGPFGDVARDADHTGDLTVVVAQRSLADGEAPHADAGELDGLVECRRLTGRHHGFVVFAQRRRLAFGEQVAVGAPDDVLGIGATRDDGRARIVHEQVTTVRVLGEDDVVQAFRDGAQQRRTFGHCILEKCAPQRDRSRVGDGLGEIDVALLGRALLVPGEEEHADHLVARSHRNREDRSVAQTRRIGERRGPRQDVDPVGEREHAAAQDHFGNGRAVVDGDVGEVAQPFRVVPGTREQLHAPLLEAVDERAVATEHLLRGLDENRGDVGCSGGLRGPGDDVLECGQAPDRAVQRVRPALARSLAGVRASWHATNGTRSRNPREAGRLRPFIRFRVRRALSEGFCGAVPSRPMGVRR